MRRLPNSTIQSLFDFVRPRRGKAFLVRVQESSADDHQVACIIPKKQVAKAHDRNLIRRRAKAAIQEILAYKSAKNYDILVLGSGKAQDYSYADYLAEFTDLLESIAN